MEFKPIENNVIVKEIKVKQSDGGLMLLEQTNMDARKATVIAVGPGLRKIYNDGTQPDGDSRYKMQMQIGDTVIIPSMTGSVLKTKDDEFIVIRENEILTIINNNTNED